jgi:long-chain acyl-CoA synthetase
MSIFKKITHSDAITEQAYFDALYSSVHVNGLMICLGQLLQRAFHLFPDNIALIATNASVTYKELYYRASLLSRVLINKGVKPHDRVLLFFENSVEFYVGYFAIAQAGAVVAPLNTFLHETELRHIVSDAQPVAVVAHSSHTALFNAVGVSLDMLVTECDMDMSSEVPVTLEQQDIVVLPPHDMAALLYTSGTTGLPKGVMLSSRNILTNAIQGLARSRLTENERVFGVLPLFHSFSQNVCVWAGMLSGFSVILVPKIDRRYIMAALKFQPTLFVGVPALYGLLCLIKTADFSQVKYFVSGGDTLPDKIRMYFELLYRRKICNGYGLTEASPFVSVDLEDVTEPTSCVGAPLIGIEAAIFDEYNNPMSQGSIGHLVLKGDNVMMGYYNCPDMTAAAVKDNWLYTGDLAYLDDGGKIVITGRIKDLIIHKGFNIYPAEIENIVLSHPNVIRVAVVGKVDEEFGEVPVAFVQIRAEQQGIEKELKALCSKHLASYKVPKDFIVSSNELPTTATGKVDKKILRKKL